MKRILAKEKLSWEPTIRWEEGLKRTIAYFGEKSQVEISSVIQNLIGAASGFTKEEIENDERLSYLLSK